jgi:hypothetical protein
MQRYEVSYTVESIDQQTHSTGSVEVYADSERDAIVQALAFSVLSAPEPIAARVTACALITTQHDD